MNDLIPREADSAQACSGGGAARTSSWDDKEGAPAPLGVSFASHTSAYNFALYSKHATGVVLLLYSADDPVRPLLERRLDPLHNKSGRVWHCRLPAALVAPASYYGYRVEGPFNPRDGHRFDADKILLDPYARQVYFPPGFSRPAASEHGRNDGRAPLGVIHPRREPFDWTGDTAPRHTHDTIVYELHVRGFTRRANSGVSVEKRGTYAGLIEKIPYLRDLGVTVVELLPVHQRDPGERNYWGYMTLNFFSVEVAYATDAADAVREFQSMVKALHEAGIEVVLDVAYNHTAEGAEHGPTYSYRGIDNSTYYLLERDRRWYRNDSGCGNVLHTANAATRKLILDSMRFWLQEMHVDGFRFDLASIFSRSEDGVLNVAEPPIIADISTDPAFAGARLIAEAWDLTTYQLGRRFPGISWLQWNGRFRDDVRAFVRGDDNIVPGLITRIYGSDDLFPDTPADAYHAYQSVNYVTCHDGLNLYDLVAYDRKRNLPNGHDNQDGMQDDHSWNCGWEGDEGAPAEVLALRTRQVKNLCALLMLSNGTPMFCAGDEFMHTQQGNNNPYNQDADTTWLDWDKLAAHADVFRFFKHMIAFRKRHPSLARSRCWRDDVRWYGPTGAVDQAGSSHTLAFLLHGASEGDDDLYVMINAWKDDVAFVVQDPGTSWCRVVDTALASPHDIAEPGSEVPQKTRAHRVAGRSVVVLVRRAGP